MPDSTKVVRYGRNEFLQHEFTAAVAVTTGMLLERAGDHSVQPHSTDGERPAEVLVCKDDRDRGMELGDAYPAGDDAVKALAASGGGLHLLLAAGETVEEDDLLVSAGTGEVRAYDDVGGDVASDAVARAAEDRTAGAEAVYVSADVMH